MANSHSPLLAVGSEALRANSNLLTKGGGGWRKDNYMGSLNSLNKNWLIEGGKEAHKTTFVWMRLLIQRKYVSQRHKKIQKRQLEGWDTLLKEKILS